VGKGKPRSKERHKQGGSSGGGHKRSIPRPRIPDGVTAPQRESCLTWLTIIQQYLGRDYSREFAHEGRDLVVTARGTQNGVGHVRIKPDGVVLGYENNKRIML
jgi:hypothetical protein